MTDKLAACTDSFRTVRSTLWSGLLTQRGHPRESGPGGQSEPEGSSITILGVPQLNRLGSYPNLNAVRTARVAETALEPPITGHVLAPLSQA